MENNEFSAIMCLNNSRFSCSKDMARNKMIWKSEYSETQNDIQVECYSVPENECLDYFSNRVSTKVTEADGTEQLREYLSSLQATGFDSNTLLSQLEVSHLPKDWEVGECFAESVLEDNHDAMFPWSVAWDKRTTNASLPGADIVGFQDKVAPRFIFGQVKSSSEKRVPPQVVNSGSGCLKEQMRDLQHKKGARQQLIQWILPRVKGTFWEKAFSEALAKYADKNYLLVGLLVSGGRNVNEKDLTVICAEIKHTAGDGEIMLFGYYLPLDKSKWVIMIQGGIKK